MNIQDYNKVVDKIHADQDKLLDGIQEKYTNQAVSSRLIFKPQLAFAIASLVVILIFVGSFFPLFYVGQKDNFSNSITITAHAAGSDSVLLSDKPVQIQCNSEMEFGVSDVETGWGVLNYNLWFQCEGGDGDNNHIAQITYKCADNIDSENYMDASHYFVKNITVPVTERAQYTYIRSLQSSADQEKNICDLVLLIGDEITVSYEEQTQQNLSMEIKAKVENTQEGDEEQELFYAEPFHITIILNMTDGSTIMKTLKVTPMENALDGIILQIVE